MSTKKPDGRRASGRKKGAERAPAQASASCADAPPPFDERMERARRESLEAYERAQASPDMREEHLTAFLAALGELSATQSATRALLRRHDVGPVPPKAVEAAAALYRRGEDAPDDNYDLTGPVMGDFWLMPKAWLTLVRMALEHGKAAGVMQLHAERAPKNGRRTDPAQQAQKRRNDEIYRPLVDGTPGQAEIEAAAAQLGISFESVQREIRRRRRAKRTE